LFANSFIGIIMASYNTWNLSVIPIKYAILTVGYVLVPHT